MSYEIINNDFTRDPNTALGITFPFDAPGVYRPGYTTPEQASNNFRNLLLTVVDEKYEVPGFGTDLLHVVFEPATDGIKEVISEIITNAVNHWLPYITITELTVTTQLDDPTSEHNVNVFIMFNVESSEFDQSIQLMASETGQLTVLINNAGVSGYWGATLPVGNQ